MNAYLFMLNKFAKAEILAIDLYRSLWIYYRNKIITLNINRQPMCLPFHLKPLLIKYLECSY